MLRTITTVAIALFIGAQAGCGGDSPSGPPNSKVTRVEIEGGDALMVIGDSLRFTARALDASGQPVAGAALVWHISDNTVAVVSTSGMVKALAGGTTALIARSGSLADTVTITVTASRVANVILTVPTQHVKVSDTIQATARAVDAAGATVAGRPVTWGSSDSSAAVITPFGLILGIAPANPVQITATIDGHSASVPIAVVPAAIAQVQVSPDTSIIFPGSTVQFQAKVINEFGFEVTDRPVTWSSFITDVATIDQNGLATAHEFGESTISATVGGVTGNALIRVIDAATATFRITVTNYLIYPVAVALNGKNIGLVGAQSTGSFDRPLVANAAVSAALVPTYGHGEPIGESWPTVADPTGEIKFEIDNTLDDGSVYFTPVVRNLIQDNKFLLDPLPKVRAARCACIISPELPDNRDSGYWLLNGASLLRFYSSDDGSLSTVLKTVPVPTGDVEDRSGIFRYTLTSVP